MAKKTDIRLRRSNVANAIPGHANLSDGELAINTMDGALYFKKSDNTIITAHDDTIMHIDSDNSRVGIGETTPDRKFHVKDSNYRVSVFERTGAPNSYIVFKDPNTTQDVGLGATTNDLKFRSGNVDHLSLLGSNGHLKFTDFDQQLEFGSTSNKFGYNQWLMSASGGASIKNVAGPLTINPDDFTAFQVNDVERARFNTYGLGIGTTTPHQWASYTDNAATVLQVADTNNRARLVIKGGNGAHLDLVDHGGGTDDKHMNIAVDGGILKFGSLTDANNAFVQNNILVMDLGGANVGIGTASPNRKLHVNGSGSTVALKVEATDGSQASIDLSNSEGDFRIINDAGTLQFYDDADSTERMRIDTTGTVYIGSTGDSGSNYHRLSHDGFVRHKRTNQIVAVFDRDGTDGNIIHLRKSGSDVGTIGTLNGNVNIISNDVGLTFAGGNDSIIPTDSDGSYRGNAIDLGHSTQKFKDLHLSGAVNTGTISANSGTTNTVATFTSTDVGAGINLTDNSGTSTLQTYGANLRIGVDEDGAVASSAIQFRVDGSTKVTVNSDGQVLIGTSSSLHSSADLQIQGASGNYARIMLKDQDGTSQHAFIDKGGAEFAITSQDGTSHGAIALKQFDGTDTLTRLRIDASGNIGIGTSSPAFTNGSGLEIEKSGASTLRIQRSGGDAAELFMDTNGFHIKDLSHGTMTFGTTNSERMRIDSSGRVGIGVTSPNVRLHIADGSGDTTLAINNSTQVTGNTARIDLRHNGITGSQIKSSNIEDFTSNANRTSDLTFVTRNNGTFVQAMHLQEDGKVGISTTAPSTKLEVSSGAADVTTIKASYNSTNYLEFAHNRINAVSSGGNDSILFQTAGTTRAIINQSGNVGIGLLSPGVPLDVQSNSSAEGIRVRARSSDEIGQLTFTTSGGTARNQLQTSSAFFNIKAIAAIPMIFYTSNLERMRIQSNGDVGIGTTSTSEKLHIKGSGNESVKLRLEPGTTAGNVGAVTLGRTDGSGNVQLTDAVTGGVPIGGVAGIMLGSTNGSIPAVAIQTPNSSSGHIVFNPKGTEKVRITADGLVGIGVTVPALQSAGTGLHINGSSNAEIKFTNSTTGTAATNGTALVVSGSSFNINNREAGNLIFGTSNSERMRISSTGQVGINRTSFLNTNVKLEVGGADNVPLIAAEASGVRAGLGVQSSGLGLYVGTTNVIKATSGGAVTFNNAYTFPTSDGSAGQVLKTDGSGTLTFQNDSGGGSAGSSIVDTDNDTKIQVEESADEDIIRFDIAGTEQMQLNSTGLTVAGNLTVNGTQTVLNTTTLDVEDLNITVNKGGTTSAGADGAGLTIEGPTSNASLIWDHGNQYLELNKSIFTPGSFIIGTTGTNVGRMYNSSGVMALEAYTTRQISFGNATNGEHVRIDADGKVGIGVTSPSSILDIRGSGNVDIMSKIINTGQTSSGRKTEFVFGKDNGANLSGVLKYVYDTTQASRRIDLFHYQTTNGISILDGGNVGIGESSPGQKLQVNGNIRADGSFNVGGTIVVTSTRGFNAADGSASAPTHTFHSDQDTGMYRIGANHLGFATGGSSRWSIDSSGGITQNGGSNYDYSGGGNFSIRHLTASQNITFATKNSSNTLAEKMRIRGDGNVGIGTTTPLTLLNVVRGGSPGLSSVNARTVALFENNNSAGTVISINAPATGYAGIFFGDDTSEAVGQIKHLNSDNSMQFVTQGGSTEMTLKNGKLGIGITSPSSILTVDSGTATGAAYSPTSFNSASQIKIDVASAQNNYAGIQFTHSGNTEGFIGLVRTSTNISDADFVIQSYSHSTSSYSEKMRITDEGNVGIGTTSPTDPLVVQSSGSSMGGGATLANSYFTITDGTTSMFHDPNELFSNINGSFHIGATHANGLLRFQTGGTSTRMVILANGKVGIGTDSPFKTFEVSFNDNSTNVGASLSGGGTGPGVLIKNTNTTAGISANLDFRANNADARIAYKYNAINDGDFHFITDNVDSIETQMIIKNDGKVGIGTLSPSYLLELADDTNSSVDLLRLRNNDATYAQTMDFELDTSKNLVIHGSSGAGGIIHDIGSNGFVLKQNGTQHTKFTANKMEVTGDFEVDASGDITLDADGGDIIFMDGGSDRGRLSINSHLILKSQIADADILFQCNDAGIGNITALTIDASDLGTAIFNHDIKLGDNGIAKFGTSDDLQIYHDGSNSYIQDTGTGALILKSGGTMALRTPSDENMIHMTANGAVNLYHDNVNKLQTATTGVNITGELETDTLNVNDNYNIDTASSNSSGTTQISIKNFPKATFRSARFTIQITNTTDSTYHSTEILAVHDGSTANITEFGEVHTGSSVEATFDADINGSNFRLLATPTSTDSMTFKVVVHAITV